jgi:hypothetical protein
VPTVPTKFGSISRAEFVRKFVAAGFEYPDAHKAYKVVVSTFEDALLTNCRVSIGRVGALVPVKRPPRVVKMGFQRTKRGVVKKQREFSYGEVVRWKFKVFRKFAKEHGIDGRIV